jgi:hypothetical protein
MPLGKNISTGPRGAWQGATLVMAEPGQVIEADAFEPEWFEEVDGAEEGEPEGLGDMTVAELKALADGEGIDLGDATKKADIISAIDLAREAAE